MHSLALRIRVFSVLALCGLLGAGCGSSRPAVANRSTSEASLSFDDLPYENRLNEKEKALLREDPVAGAKALLAANTAQGLAAEHYQPDESCQHNDNADAFRHALWNCLMRDSIGESMAKRWGDAHEDYPGNPPLEKSMDLFNNEKGRSIQLVTPEKEAEAILSVKTLVRGGFLRRIVQNVLVKTDRTCERILPP